MKAGVGRRVAEAITMRRVGKAAGIVSGITPAYKAARGTVRGGLRAGRAVDGAVRTGPGRIQTRFGPGNAHRRATDKAIASTANYGKGAELFSYQRKAATKRAYKTERQGIRRKRQAMAVGAGAVSQMGNRDSPTSANQNSYAAKRMRKRSIGTSAGALQSFGAIGSPKSTGRMF
jgi:hypothetical protein